ncbi:OmcA/MtrC family decaheme c-type cytochrome [Chrysiogenes arsenatis]|uniref:OmcA/MtrC family decaheme c-type cytochrome n=1 Tax=Chrysiogenes arsenatis TaxID=309797 RepID=UPI00040A2364|nr:OmcA/MtrC family decaheme c-type cytochrome [Chrysiogenes arsenatis]
MSRTETADTNDFPNGLSSALQATAVAGTAGALSVENKGGNAVAIKFQFPKTLSEYDNVAFDKYAVHRIGIQINTNATKGRTNAINIAYDFVPADLSTPADSARREVAKTATCLECHEKGSFRIHGGNRVDVAYCVTCHNPYTTDAQSGNSLDMTQMIHKIHMGHKLPSLVEDSKEYAIYGYNMSKHTYATFDSPEWGGVKYAGAEPAGVVYPAWPYGHGTAQPMNCAKCHRGDTVEANDTGVTAAGNNWKTNPSYRACFSCHDGESSQQKPFVAGSTTFLHGNFTEGTAGGACIGCHNATTTDVKLNITTAHATLGKTPLNPTQGYKTSAGVQRDLYSFEYRIHGVTTESNDSVPKIHFSILINRGDTTDTMDLFANNAELTGGPTFLVAYAQPDALATTPADWNQQGKRQGQPQTVALSSLVAGAAGDTLERQADGTYIATLNSAPFPAGATMKAIALQGYFQQTVGSESVRLATRSVVHFVDGITERRRVVDETKCLSCHDTIAFHGGNRVDNPQVCVICHNPALTSSGHTLPLLATDSSDRVGMFRTASDRLRAETSNNFKELIHGIHAGNLLGVRNQNNNPTPYDFNHNLFGNSGVAQIFGTDCTKCHITETYYPREGQGVLATVNNVRADTTDEDSSDSLRAAMASITNSADRMTTAYGASCATCHISSAAKTHMQQYGAQFAVRRDALNPALESCARCHGKDEYMDVRSAHRF